MNNLPDSNMKSINGLYIMIVVVFIIVCISIAVYADYVRKKQIEMINLFAKKSGYFDARYEFMADAFHVRNYIFKNDVSSVVLNSFINSMNNGKYVNYLIKYFDMNITDDTVSLIKNLEKTTNDFYLMWRGTNIPFAYFNDLLPKFIMSYTSPAGRVYRESVIVLDIDTLVAMKNDIQAYISRGKHISNERGRMTAALRRKILERDNYTCRYCGNSIYKEPNLLLEVDHIIPVSKGGKTVVNNLQTLCWKCNKQKSNKII